MAIAGYAMGATVGYNYLRGEFHHEPFERFEQALAEAYEAGLLGKDIEGSGVDMDIFTVLGAGAYICGEETALMESLEGKKGQPRFKPPFPANFGLYGLPSTINNTETLASVPAIMRNGADWFLQIGKPNNGGPKCFSVSGHVAKPGNYEVPLGTPFSELLERAGGMRAGHKLKAVIPGGSSMPVLPAEIIMDCTMDFDALSKAGSGLGSGAVIVMDETTCMGPARSSSWTKRPAWCGPASVSPASITWSPAANARPAARARAGCIGCYSASLPDRAVAETWNCCARRRARSKATRFAPSVRQRPGRCRGSCAITGTSSSFTWRTVTR
jgi:NADH:ubiquinone oxidoreductase subunit F (NADH-binding)